MQPVDLTPIIADWPYDPERISVRKILGADGRVKIQMRIELGLMQLEVAGRPDGQRPEGHESWLDLVLDRLRTYRKRNGTPLGFELSAEDCTQLREEANMYYHRAVCAFVLDEYEPVERDSAHNLAILDLCRDYAARRSDRTALEPFRVYIVTMHTRARALEALRRGNPYDALGHVDRGVAIIREHVERAEAEETFAELPEVRILRSLRQEITTSMPETQDSRLRRELRLALVEERYEDAAKIRDALTNGRRGKSPTAD